MGLTDNRPYCPLPEWWALNSGITAHSHAREAGETQGLMKVLVDAKNACWGRILGLNGDDVFHTLRNVMAAEGNPMGP